MNDNLLLWPDDSLVALGGLTDHDQALQSTARHWCDPAMFDDVVGVDFGVGKMHWYSSSTGQKKSVALEQAISILQSFKHGTLVVSEWAHMGVPQTAKSLSQPFTAEQLLATYERMKSRGITLMLFPHAHSGTRAREWVAHHMPNAVDANKTSDINDAVSIALFVRHCNDVSLAHPPRSFKRCKRRDYGRAVTDLSNIILNAERTRGYTGKMFPAVVAIGREVRRKCSETAIDHKVAISIASTVVHERGGRRFLFSRNGRAPGAWFWLRHVMRFSPFHHRGGIARSNLMRHRFRPWLEKFANRHGLSVKTGKKYMKFAHFNQQQNAVRTAAMRAFRKSVLNAYRVAVAIAEQQGFEHFDPSSDSLDEVIHGR